MTADLVQSCDQRLRADELGDCPLAVGRFDFEELLGAGVGQQQRIVSIDGDHRFRQAPQDAQRPFGLFRRSARPQLQRGPGMLGLGQLLGQFGAQPQQVVHRAAPRFAPVPGGRRGRRSRVLKVSRLEPAKPLQPATHRLLLRERAAPTGPRRPAGRQGADRHQTEPRQPGWRDAPQPRHARGDAQRKQRPYPRDLQFIRHTRPGQETPKAKTDAKTSRRRHRTNRAAPASVAGPAQKRSQRRAAYRGSSRRAWTRYCSAASD